MTEIAGDVGAKLHTGRSRNDQVATDLRLYTRRELLARGRRRCSACRRPRRNVPPRPVTPTCLATRTCSAPNRCCSPITSSAHGWALARDVDRLLHTVVRMDVCPLGAGALAGSSLALDPDGVAEDLGFAGRFENSLDAVSDRDFVAEALFDLALLGVHLSRLGEEFVLWSSEEFGFVVLDDRYATGSSMLPQKKNPDVAELAAGQGGPAHRARGGDAGHPEGTPLAYNRDLQEDKEPLFDAVDQIGRALSAVTGMVHTAQFDTDRMRDAADGPAAAAIDLAEWLVERGMPFRKAHAVVGSLVRDSVQRGVPLAELVQASPHLGVDALALLEPGVAVTRRTSPGGAGPGPVAVQAERFRHRLELDRSHVWRTPPARPGWSPAGPRATPQTGPGRGRRGTRHERGGARARAAPVWWPAPSTRATLSTWRRNC